MHTVQFTLTSVVLSPPRVTITSLEGGSTTGVVVGALVVALTVVVVRTRVLEIVIVGALPEIVTAVVVETTNPW